MAGSRYFAFAKWTSSVALALALAASTSVDATAQTTTTEQPPPLPVVRIAGTSEAGVVQDYTCDGRIVFKVINGTVTFARDDTSGSLTVAYALDGPVDVAEGDAVFAEGAATASVDVTPSARTGAPWIDVRIVPSDRYELGDPSTDTMTVARYIGDCFTTTTTATSTTTMSTAPTLLVANEELPRTGASGSVTAIAASMLAIGSAMLLARRRFGGNRTTTP